MRRAGPALPQRPPRGERGACARELGRVTGFLDAWLAGTSVVTGAGAVAGVVDDDRPRYWYPEIAGYYLSYLATLDCADQRAARIVGWLRRWWSAPGSARETRIAAPGRTAGEDWRNRWLFSFDLAMIVRGLGCHPGLSEAVALREEIAAELRERFVRRDGALAAVDGPPVPPELARWSTVEGPAQLKTLAALAAAPTAAFPAAWCSARARELLERFPPVSWSVLPLHPRCYALEGLLQLDDSPAVRTLVRLMVSAAFDRERTHADYRRVDVRAQLLRLLWIVAPDDPRVGPLRAALLGALAQGAAAPFSTESRADEYNVWATLFARQALHARIVPTFDAVGLL